MITPTMVTMEVYEEEPSTKTKFQNHGTYPNYLYDLLEAFLLLFPHHSRPTQSINLSVNLVQP